MTKSNPGLKRCFLVLEKEDLGQEGREPSGYIKIETREGKIKLYICAKNLKNLERSSYKLYMIKGGTHREIVCAGVIHTRDGTGTLETQIGTDDFDTFVVAAENHDDSKNSFLCPLTAYKKEKTDWRSFFEKRLESIRPKTVEITAAEPNDENNRKERPDKPQASSSKNLSTIFDGCFTRCNPFNTTRKDYRWWKLYSPVQLNNILYQNNIRTPLLFNPAVMKAHFKYGHLIAGIYTDSSKGREYLVCGVPETSGENEKPFGEFCRWVQTEKTGPKSGIFGYWLIYMNINDGSLINVN